DIRLAVEATRICATTREHIMRHLGSLTASDLPGLKRGFTKLDDDIRAFLLQLDKPMGMMPVDRVVKIRQGWDVCRQFLKGFDGAHEGAEGHGQALVVQGTAEASHAGK
ncbi:MAG: hypothetical protein ACM3VT_04995, partial [Solirubrobacterales bacterium]